MTVDNATAESVDVITDALFTASRLLVAISARSIALVDETITIPPTPSTTTSRRPVSTRLRSAPTTPSPILKAKTSPPTRCALLAAHTASDAPS